VGAVTAPSELEWLGFEMALERYFFGRNAQATFLAKLCRRPGHICAPGYLVSLTATSEDAIPTHISWLREAMRDLGFMAKIENVPRCGYRISEVGAREVWDRVNSVVFHLDQAP
jgi:hypothetical protein